MGGGYASEVQYLARRPQKMFSAVRFGDSPWFIGGREPRHSGEAARRGIRANCPDHATQPAEYHRFRHQLCRSGDRRVLPGRPHEQGGRCRRYCHQ